MFLLGLWEGGYLYFGLKKKGYWFGLVVQSPKIGWSHDLAYDSTSIPLYKWFYGNLDCNSNKLEYGFLRTKTFAWVMEVAY